MTSREREPERIGLIGATGSVGSSVLGVIRHFPERFRVHSLAGGSNSHSLESFARNFPPGMPPSGMSRGDAFWRKT